MYLLQRRKVAVCNKIYIQSGRYIPFILVLRNLPDFDVKDKAWNALEYLDFSPGFIACLYRLAQRYGHGFARFLRNTAAKVRKNN